MPRPAPSVSQIDGSNLFRIVIVAYNSQDVLDATLTCLFEQSYRDFEVVIVDNDCPQRSGHLARLPDKRFRTLTSPSNLGFAGGCNLGAKGASSQWLIMLNPDARPRRTWLTEIVSGINRYGADVYGSTQISHNKRWGDFIDGFGDAMSIFGLCWRGGYGQPLSRLPDEDREVLTPCAAAAVYRRSAFEAVGGFDESFFCYLEDVDLGLRLRGSGSRCIQLRGAVVDHDGGSSQEVGSDFSYLQTLKNTPKLIAKNIPTPLLPLVWIAMLMSRGWLDWRRRSLPRADIARAAFKEGMSAASSDLKRRPSIRRMGTLQMAGWLSWTPRAVREQPIVAKDVSSLRKGS